MKKQVKISIFFVMLFAVASSVMAQKSYYTWKIHPQWTRKYDEIAPVMLGNEMVYISNRPVSGPKASTDIQGREFFKIVTSEKIDDKNWGIQKPFSEALVSPFNEGPASFNEKGDYMVYSRCLESKSSRKDTARNGLFFADKQGGAWGNIQEFEYNDPSSNTIEPSFNKDASVMYFSSDRAGGYGKYDLYVTRYRNGKWTTPENLGPRINSAGNELFPFISYNDRLYFSSNVIDNKSGKYDIYYSIAINGKWISRIPLGPPFNSVANDYSYCVDSLGQDGFFTSDLRGSKDIYTFKSVIPKFPIAQEQKMDNYCFVLFEENTVELDTNLYLYEWSLGDNSKVRAIEAKHCYQGPGNYTVSLNVIDKLTKEVLFNQAEYDLEVKKIVQAFITCPDEIKKGEQVQFSGRESFLEGAKPGEYYWDFGDGNRDRGVTVSHTYLNAGPYEVRLYIIEDITDAVKNLKPKDAKLIKPREFCNFKTIVVKEN